MIIGIVIEKVVSLVIIIVVGIISVLIVVIKYVVIWSILIAVAGKKIIILVIAITLIIAGKNITRAISILGIVIEKIIRIVCILWVIAKNIIGIILIIVIALIGLIALIALIGLIGLIIIEDIVIRAITCSRTYINLVPTSIGEYIISAITIGLIVITKDIAHRRFTVVRVVGVGVVAEYIVAGWLIIVVIHEDIISGWIRTSVHRYHLYIL